MKDNEEKLWILMKVYPRRTFWMAMLIMFLFASIFLILLPIGLIWFPNDSDRFGNFGLAAILSMMGIVYIINWVNCFRFIKKANDLRYKDLEEAFLKRLIKMYILAVLFLWSLLYFLSVLRDSEW